METRVPLLGIIRNSSSLNSAPGSCLELINLRKKHGSLRPILPKEDVLDGLPTADNVFVHTIEAGTLEYYIVATADGNVKVHATDDGAAIQTLLTLTPGNEVLFSYLKYFLIVTDIDAKEKYIFQCDPDDAVSPYTNVSSIPFLNVTFTSDNQAISGYYDAKHDNESFQAGWYELEAQMRELYPDYFEGYIFIKYAIELIDGTTLKHSSPFFLYNGSVTFTDNTYYGRITANLYRIKYTVFDSLPADWANYEKLIRGISIFITKPIGRYDLDLSGYTEGGTFLGLVEKTNLLVDLFRNETAYYRIHTIPYSKVSALATGTIGTKTVVTSSPRRGGSTTATGGRISRLKQSIVSDISNALHHTGEAIITKLNSPAVYNINDITSYDIMNVDDVSHHEVISEHNLNYNSRIYMGKIYSKLFDGFDISDVIREHGAPLLQFDIWLEVDINTDQGTKTVQQTKKHNSESIRIPYLLAYPDIRAVEIRIIHNSGGTNKKVTFILEPHPGMNVATAIKKDDVDINIAAKDTDGFQYITIGEANSEYEYEDANAKTAITVTPAVVATPDTSIQDLNRIQLTELYNPFALPAINSYQVGEGEVVALAVNMIPLDDRFGVFPVFVFNTKGIWALNLSDSGSVVVGNIVPVSNFVCTNSKSVIVVDDLICFLASDGIKLMTGQTPADISELAEGDEESVLDSINEYDQILDHASLGAASTLISSTDLLTYAAGASFAFNKSEREIIVSNPSYAYSYIFNVAEKMWYKSSHVFKMFVNNYPDIFGIDTNDALVDISKEDATGAITAYLESRAIQLSQDRPAKIQRIVLDGLFNVNTAKYAAVYIFGSNDGVDWALVTGKEITGAGVYSIIIPKVALSLRYIVISFSGILKEGSALGDIRLIS